MLPIECLAALTQAGQKAIADAGRADVWDNILDEGQQSCVHNAAYATLCCELGEKAFEELSEVERHTANFYVWAGCCMHKELNSVKGATLAMSVFWVTRNIVGPRKLINKDNPTAVEGGTSEASLHALEVLTGGVIKLTSLAGAIFNYKDDKKGQGNRYRFSYANSTGQSFTFSNTSNTCYQSYCFAAIELAINLKL